MDKKECIEFWQALPDKLEYFARLDDAEIVFGANTKRGGHQYRRLPLVSENEIVEFENRNGFEIPLEYRTYLQVFGAGGGGPHYGIYDFRKYVFPNNYTKPYPYDEEVYYDDVDDDDPVWDYPGIAFFGDIGCGTVFGIELNGPSPGRIWVDWSEACSPGGTFLEIYQNWIDKVENGLERYHVLKSLLNGQNRVDRPEGLTFDEIVAHMQCGFTESKPNIHDPAVPVAERWIRFDKTPALIVLDENDVVLSVEVFDRGSIN